MTGTITGHGTHNAGKITLLGNLKRGRNITEEETLYIEGMPEKYQPHQKIILHELPEPNPDARLIL